MHDGEGKILSQYFGEPPRPGKTKGNFSVRAKWENFCPTCFKTLKELGHRIPHTDESFGTTFLVPIGVFDIVCVCANGSPMKLFGSPYVKAE